ncbi:hypothetical protein [Methylobacterium brachiatum]|uniref:hypothetical protein n=1 Tax=Methylobacterium brachiatum TaxID=269660 RepID=UPI0013CEB421|nr:hypothetical protein [Methylobacterium brachiatum]
MEDRINTYLEVLEREGQKVVQVHSTVTQVGEPNGGTDAYAVYTVWYEPVA